MFNVIVFLCFYFILERSKSFLFDIILYITFEVEREWLELMKACLNDDTRDFKINRYILVTLKKLHWNSILKKHKR